jgi:hypothetical protein
LIEAAEIAPGIGNRLVRVGEHAGPVAPRCRQKLDPIALANAAVDGVAGATRRPSFSGALADPAAEIFGVAHGGEGVGPALGQVAADRESCLLRLGQAPQLCRGRGGQPVERARRRSTEAADARVTPAPWGAAAKDGSSNIGAGAGAAGAASVRGRGRGAAGAAGGRFGKLGVRNS